MGSFSATVKKFTIDAEKNTTLIFRDAAYKLAKEVITPRAGGGRNDIGPSASGGFLPSDTGNLGRSFSVSTTSMPKIDAGSASYLGNAEVSFSISNAKAGDTLYMGFQAAYAPRQNYGFVGTDSLGRTYNQTGNYFVENAGAKWQQFVTEAETLYGE